MSLPALILSLLTTSLIAPAAALVAQRDPVLDRIANTRHLLTKRQNACNGPSNSTVSSGSTGGTGITSTSSAMLPTSSTPIKSTSTSAKACTGSSNSTLATIGTAVTSGFTSTSSAVLLTSSTTIKTTSTSVKACTGSSNSTLATIGTTATTDSSNSTKISSTSSVLWTTTSSAGSTQTSSPSTCLSYGIDFQDGGNYFINEGLATAFTAVSQFTGCQPGEADVVLVQDSTGTQYACSNVMTSPDNVSVTSTCPLLKSQMNTGEWSLIVIGDNGDGTPFAYQRNFLLTVGFPVTITSTPTVTYTFTSYPNVTVTSTSFVYNTSTITNDMTVTVPASTTFSTVTPPPTNTTTTQTVSRTVTRFTETLSTITQTNQPYCSIPSRPWDNDPWCQIVPTVVPVPYGISFKRADQPMDLHRRAPDVATITMTASVPINSTITSHAPTTTFTNTELDSTVVYTTEPPKTIVTGVEIDTITLPQSTTTITSSLYTKVTTTTTVSETWIYTTVPTPNASQSASCKAEGGHYGHMGYGY